MNRRFMNRSAAQSDCRHSSPCCAVRGRPSDNVYKKIEIRFSSDITLIATLFNSFLFSRFLSFSRSLLFSRSLPQLLLLLALLPLR